MSIYLGRKGQGYIQQTGFCQRCGWKYLRTQLTEDDYIKGLLVCVYCHDPDQPQRYPVEPRAEGFPPLVPAPDQYPGPLAPVLSGTYFDGNTINLSWTASVDNADLINQYFIYRTFNGGPAELIASVPFIDSYDFPNNQVEPFTSPTVYSDDTVTPGQTYTYYVIAEAVDHRQSPPSNVISIFTQPPPVSLSGFFNFSTDQVDLTWTLPSSWQPFVTNFVLYRSVNGAGFSPLTTLSPSTFAYIDTTATDFLDEYEYYIITEYGATNSLASNIVTAPTIVTEVFTVASSLFIPPVGLQKAVVSVVGDGGGGGGGGPFDANEQSGGFGGAAGGISIATFTALEIGTGPITVTVGQGGPGAPTVQTTGNAISPKTYGSDGTGSSFGSLLVAGGGQAVNPDIGHTGIGGAGTTQQGAGRQVVPNAGQPASQDSSNNTFPAVVGDDATIAPGSGGGGGCSNHFNEGQIVPAAAGGSGQTSVDTSLGGQPGTVAGQNGFPGADAVAGTFAGGGGGGGCEDAGPVHAVGGDGGKGGKWGGGGGGGGVGVAPGVGGATQIQGAGGDGGPGIVVVVTYS